MAPPDEVSAAQHAADATQGGEALPTPTAPSTIADKAPVLDPAAHVEIVKPKSDEFSYRAIVLPNGLKAVLVSDPTADKAGAALDVSAGRRICMCRTQRHPCSLDGWMDGWMRLQVPRPRCMSSDGGRAWRPAAALPRPHSTHIIYCMMYTGM